MTTRLGSSLGAEAGHPAAQGENPERTTNLSARIGAWLPDAGRRLLRWLTSLTRIVMAIVVLALVLIGWKHLSSRTIALGTVSLPESLSKTELSPGELTQRLADKLDSLSQAAGTTEGGVFALESDVQLPDIEVPGVGLKFAQMLDLIASAIGRSHRRTVWEISARPQAATARGSVAPNAVPSQVWLLTARVSGSRSHQVLFDPANPDPAISAIAVEILADAEPVTLVRSLLFGQDCDGARARATAYLRRISSVEERARIYNTLGLSAECPFRDSEAGIDDHPDYGEAERYYREAIRLDPEFLMPSVNLARIRVQQDTSSASAMSRDLYLAFDSAAKRDPTLADVQEAWGYSFVLYGQNDSAITHLSHAVEMNHAKPITTRILAQTYAQVGRTADAIHTFSLAVARDPNDVIAWRDYGHALLKSRDPVGASRAFARARRLDPSDLDTHLSYAEALARAGRPVALDVYCRVKARALPGSQHYVSADSAVAAIMQSEESERERQAYRKLAEERLGVSR